MQWLTSYIVFGLIAAIVLSVEIGYRLGLRRLSRLPEAARSSIGFALSGTRLQRIVAGTAAD